MSPYSSRSVSKARICWMRSDHCWSHGRGRPEGLVPGRQLHGPGPGALGQRDAEGLEHDALHVVLGLLLGQAERVDLHAVAEAAQLGVLDAVALAADAVPQRGEGPHLARLLDEADAGVDEEADAADHGGQLVGVDLARVAHAVEHADGGGQGVGDLLDRRGPGLLQVVAADVDRVPLGRVAHRVGDGVDGEAEARAGREDVGAPAEVLLDDVVLRRARQAARVDAVVLGVGDVEAEQPGRGGVDRHGRVHLRHGDARPSARPCGRGGPPGPRPCPPRRPPRGRRGRSRSGSAGRRRSRGRSGPWPGWSGTARWRRGRVEWPE